jgi:uncharacterized protein (TIGR03000 family)
MFRRWFTVLGVPALAAALVLVLVETASARPWFGYGRGGYYGYYTPGYTSSYPGYYGGWYSYPRYYGWYSSPGYYYPGGYNYAYSNYSPGYYTTYPSPSYAPEYSYTGPASNYTSFYPPEAAGQSAPDENAALIDVKVPADADVWFNGTKTRQTGANREFESPTLTPGKTYGYDIKARWMGDDGEVTRTKHVTIRAGDHKTVDFRNEVPPAPPRREK